MATIIVNIIIVLILISLFFIIKNDNATYLKIRKQYFELSKLSLKNPSFIKYSVTKKFYQLKGDKFKKKYHNYAFKSWQLVEKIYDIQKNNKKILLFSNTWEQIIQETNRLHFTWFKYHIRLFKPAFQSFVLKELNGIEIEIGNVEDLRSIYPSFVSDFPKNERKELCHLEFLLKENYRLVLLKN